MQPFRNTPTPYTVEMNSVGQAYINAIDPITGEHNLTVASTFGPFSEPNGLTEEECTKIHQANADFIVKAVNAYDELIALAKYARAFATSYGLTDEDDLVSRLNHVLVGEK